MDIESCAKGIVDNQRVINGFRILDSESENVLSEIVKQYDGNPEKRVLFDSHVLQKPLQDSIELQMEKLMLYGKIATYIPYSNGIIVSLLDSAMTYSKEKEKRLEYEKKMPTTAKKYDVFVSHASSDKESYVNDLVDAVSQLGIEVFYDSKVLSWGDNWKQVILDGTASSEFAIIVISDKFFGREWTEKELNEFLNRQYTTGQKVVLPLLLRISFDDLKKHYPDLGDIHCLEASKFSFEQIAILLAKELIKRYKQ